MANGDYVTLWSHRIGLFNHSNTDTFASKSIAVTLVDGTGAEGVTFGAVPALAADTHAPAAATDAVVTYAAVAAKKHYLYSVVWSYSATPTGGNLKIEDVSGTTVFTTDIAAAGPGQLLFAHPIVSSLVNTAMIVTLASGAGTVVGKLSCQHQTI